MTARIKHPARGWGRVTKAEVNPLSCLYPNAGHPEVFLFVRWDRGGGGAVDAASSGLIVEGAAELAGMVASATVERGPGYLPDLAALNCRRGDR